MYFGHRPINIKVPPCYLNPQRYMSRSRSWRCLTFIRGVGFTRRHAVFKENARKSPLLVRTSV